MAPPMSELLRHQPTVFPGLLRIVKVLARPLFVPLRATWALLNPSRAIRKNARSWLEGVGVVSKFAMIALYSTVPSNRTQYTTKSGGLSRIFKVCSFRRQPTNPRALQFLPSLVIWPGAFPVASVQAPAPGAARLWSCFCTWSFIPALLLPALAYLP